MKEIREPLTGFIASITVKGSGDIAAMIEPLTQTPHLMDYFWVGFFGAVGGLMVKLIWSLLKKHFPQLKKFDQ
ncbi:MAG: hypothetical protein Q8N05_05685 [Bacteroidota bacterium]|nr:hypothetical protein [Bacteroidota bacterium]